MFNALRSPIFKKRGSVVLSLMASGAVAGAIVATHQIVQSFASGAGQYFSRQQAITRASKALALAAMAVNRNVILCSSENTEGCFVFNDPSFNVIVPRDEQGRAIKTPENFFYDKLFPNIGTQGDGAFSTCRKTYKYNEQGVGVCGGNASPNGQTVILKEMPSNSPFYKTEVTWSLRNWMDPNIAFTINSKSLTDGYLCQKSGTYEILPDGECTKLSEAESQESARTKKQCTNSGGQAIPNSVCNYFSTADFDESGVFITVKIEYNDTNEDAVTFTDVGGNVQPLPGAKEFIYLNGVVRRPLPILSFSQKEQAVCAQRCEASYAPSFGVEQNPRCVGLSDYTGVGDFVNSAYKGQGEVPKAVNKFSIKNNGPGVLYDLRFRREDIHGDSHNYEAHQDKAILRQDFFDPPFKMGSIEAGKAMIPGTAIEVSDNSIPCYVNSYYKLNVEKINCSCSLNSNDSTASSVEAKAFCAGTTGFQSALSKDNNKRVSFSTDQTNNTDAIVARNSSSNSFVDNRVGLPADSSVGWPILPVQGNEFIAQNQPSACGVTANITAPNVTLDQKTIREPEMWATKGARTTALCAQDWFIDMPFGGAEFCKSYDKN